MTSDRIVYHRNGVYHVDTVTGITVRSYPGTARSTAARTATPIASRASEEALDAGSIGRQDVGLAPRATAASADRAPRADAVCFAAPA